jgi:ATP-dependent DNA helicase
MQVEDIIGEEQQQQVVTKLHEILRPFLLRRLKKDVLLRMPPKLEIVVYCPMSSLQQEYYRHIQDGTLLTALVDLGIDVREVTGYAGMSGRGSSTKSTASTPSSSGVEDSESGGGGFTSNKLMQLRKVCNHPFLFGEPRDETGQYIGEYRSATEPS